MIKTKALKINELYTIYPYFYIDANGTTQVDNIYLYLEHLCYGSDQTQTDGHIFLGLKTMVKITVWEDYNGEVAPL